MYAVGRYLRRYFGGAMELLGCLEGLAYPDVDGR